MSTLKRDRIKLAVLLAALMGMLVGMVGCAQVKGGQSQRNDRAFSVEVKPDGSVTVTDNRESTATTQPSASGWNSLPAIGRAEEGVLSGVSFKVAKHNAVNSWPLVLLFAAGAVGLWFLGERIAAAACAGLAIITLLFPLWTAIGAVFLVIYAVWSQWTRIKQIVQGNERALEGLPPLAREEAKLRMESAQDEPTKKLVRAARGK